MDVIKMSVLEDYFKDWNGYTGTVLTQDMIANAEKELNYKLPESYIRVLSIKNGGKPRLNYCPTTQPTSWGKDNIQIEIIYGISGKHGIDSELGSKYIINEWGYPDIGIIIGLTPSGGPEAIMLDYSECGPQSEPKVIYVELETDDEKPNIITLAPDFMSFLEMCYKPHNEVIETIDIPEITTKSWITKVSKVLKQYFQESVKDGLKILRYREELQFPPEH